MSYTVRWKLALQHGSALPPTGSPLLVADTVVLIEGGAAVTFDIRAALDSISSYTLAAWSDLNIGTITVEVKMRYHSTGNTFGIYSDLGTDDSGGVNKNDFVIVSSSTPTSGTFTVALNGNTITEDWGQTHAGFRYIVEVVVTGASE